MKRFDISIAGDEQEQSRIQLEKNLLHTDLSLHLSSTHDEYSVENPRHQSSISAPLSAFDSIDRSREGLDFVDGLSELQAWSYRTGEDDEGIHPFVGGETLSTAAHHASALTLSAGLAGRGERRDVSLSGAEYDPERPLQDLIAGMGTKVLSVHHVKATAHRVRSPYSEQSTSSSSEPDTPDPTSARPKFSDALSHLIFSPKRPRSPALQSRSISPANANGPTLGGTSTSNQPGSQHPTQPHRVTVRPSSLRVSQMDVREGEPTPRPRKVYLRPQAVNSSNALHVPTPSTADSNFTRLARGLAAGTKESRSMRSAREKRAVPARLQLAMNLLQKKIAHLDTENHASRRRMKELERELDLCRQDVERQRELVMRREEQLMKQQRAELATSKLKGKARAVEDTKEEQKRYKQAVEEKKALESLITVLRSHMARLTSELSSHKTLLDDLRSLREADKNTLRQKVREVDLLRQEVEKIAGEVEVLKGVVEEGLRERRERSLSHPHDELQARHLDVDQGEGSDHDEVEREQESLGAHQDADDYEIEDVQPALARRALLERTIRTDYATFGSSQVPGNGDNMQRYVEDSELERISADLEERRSERSRSSSRLGSSVSSNGSHRAPSVASSICSARGAAERATTPDSLRQRRRQASVPLPVQDPRPPAPTPAQARGRHHAGGEVPFPQIRGARLERMFFSAPEHNTQTCTVCNRRRYREAVPRQLWYPASKGHNVTVADANDEDEGFGEGSVIEAGEGRKTVQGTATVNFDFLKGDAGNGHLPPQTVLVRVLRELEDDFTHYKGIYTELAEQYKIMDAASNVVKRNVLAQHLREVIDVLEQKGDQIASLYDLLTFEDKPVARSVVPEKDPEMQEPAGLERTRHRESRKRLAFA